MILLICICLILQFFYWNILFSKLWRYKDKFDSTEKLPLSILICAKNEKENLNELIPILKSQDASAPSEILILNDHSSDDTSNYINANFPEVILINNPKNVKGKKASFYHGVEFANHAHLLLTDADCRPSKRWSESMATAINGKEIVLGYSPYFKKEGFLNLWIRFEAALTAFQYFSAALWGQPYMGVGRNLLYKKSLLLNSSFEKHLDLASGDDDLTINQIANASNTSINLDPKSWVYSEPSETWKEYFNQKSRHYSTSHRYKTSIIIFLTIFSGSWLGFYVALFFLFLSGNLWIALTFLIVRLCLTLYPIAKLFKRFGIPDAIKYWPLLDFFSVLYFITFAIYTLPNKKQNW